MLMQTVIHALASLSGPPCADPIAKFDYRKRKASRFFAKKAAITVNLVAPPRLMRLRFRGLSGGAPDRTTALIWLARPSLNAYAF